MFILDFVTRGAKQATADITRVGKASKFAGSEANKAQKHIKGLNNRFANINKDANRASESLLGFGKSAGGLKSLGGVMGKVALLMGSLEGVKSSIMASMASIETTNLFSVSFGDMAVEGAKALDQMNKIAGLDITNLRNTAGTYSLLARSMGIAGDDAKSLALNTNKLALDLASLTNVPINQVMADLRSGLVGQSETVYKYGIDVTEASLKAEALAQGISKSVRNMGQGEKMALRYAVMIKQTSLAQGDFARTIDQPANQLRILHERFTTLSRSIGSIFIPALSYILPYLNAIVKGLIVVADAIAKVFGFKPPEVKNMQNGFSGVADEAENVDDAIGGASKSAKSLKNSLLGIDEINLLPQETPSSGGGGGGGGVGGASALGDMDFSGYDNMFDSINDKSEKIFQTLKSWSVPVIDFVDRLMVTSGAIGKVLLPVIVEAFNNLKPAFMTLKGMFAMVFGDMSSFGKPLESWIYGGFVPLLMTFITVSSEILAGLTNVFTMVFGGLWNNVVMPSLQFFMDEGLPMVTEFTDEVILALGTMFAIFKDVFDRVWLEAVLPNFVFITNVFFDLGKTLVSFWNKYGKPIFDAFKTTWTEVADTFKVVWEGVIRPILDDLRAGFERIWTASLKPLIENVAEFAGEFMLLINAIWTNALLPFIKILIEKFGPSVTATFKTVWSVIQIAIELVIDIINSVMRVFKGITQFLLGVFTGDWQKAWKGIENIYKGVVDAFYGILKGGINLVITALNGMIGAFEKGLNYIISKMLGSDIIKAYNKMVGLFGGTKIDVGFQLNIPRIPKLATGGTLSEGQLFQAGEFGKAEMIGSYQGKTTVMPLENTSFVSAIGTAVFNAVKSAMPSTSDSDGGDIILQVGETELGRVAINGINKVTKQEGRLILNI